MIIKQIKKSICLNNVSKSNLISIHKLFVSIPHGNLVSLNNAVFKSQKIATRRVCQLLRVVRQMTNEADRRYGYRHIRQYKLFVNRIYRHYMHRQKSRPVLNVKFNDVVYSVRVS